MRTTDVFGAEQHCIILFRDKGSDRLSEACTLDWPVIFRDFVPVINEPSAMEINLFASMLRRHVDDKCVYICIHATDACEIKVCVIIMAWRNLGAMKICARHILVFVYITVGESGAVLLLYTYIYTADAKKHYDDA